MLAAIPETRPLRVRRVLVEGENLRTHPSVVEAELEQEGLLSAQTAGDVLSVVRAAERGALAVSRLGVFDAVDVELRPAAGASGMGGVVEADVIVRVREKARWMLSSQATVGSQGAVGGELKGAMRNVFGYAEVLSGSRTEALNGTYDMAVTLRKPRFFGWPLWLDVGGHRKSLSSERFSSFSEKSYGATASLTSYDGAQAVSAEWSLRDIVPTRNPDVPFARDASHSVVSAARQSTKTSLMYRAEYDTRDNQSCPATGELHRGSIELALPPGTAQFIKGKLQTQTHTALQFHTKTPWLASLLPSFVTLSFCSMFGFVHPLSAQQPPQQPPQRAQLAEVGQAPMSASNTHLSDRFFLGGPFSLRGFEYTGVGPRAAQAEGGARGGDSLGGDLVYNALAAISFPLYPPHTVQKQARREIEDPEAALAAAPPGRDTPTPVVTNVATARHVEQAEVTNATSTSADDFARRPLVRTLKTPPVSLTNSVVGMIFCNLGNLWPSAQYPDWRRFFQGSRVSVGAGVAIPLPIGRIEFTHSIPVRADPDDIQSRWQLGASISIE